ncbi:aspartyl/asparaginyl beta-hydroxylase domain-containing protein, partial [archaeon]
MAEADEEARVLAAGLRALCLSSFSATMCARFISPEQDEAEEGDAKEGDTQVPCAQRRAACPHVCAWLRELAAAAAMDESHALSGDAAAKRRSYPMSVLRPPNKWQRGCPEIVPGLTSRPIWAGSTVSDADRHPALHFISELEAATPQIVAELLALRGCASFQQYAAPKWCEHADGGNSEGVAEAGAGVADPCSAASAAKSASIETPTSAARGTVESHAPATIAASVSACARVPAEPASSRSQASDDAACAQSRATDAGAWNVAYLDLHNVDFEANRAACPVTVAFLRSIPRLYGHTLFSATSPGTHITTHTGPTNRKLRIQLPLIVPEGDGCRLRVGEYVEVLRAGKAIVFDDSYQHEAWNDSSAARFVLIFDIWHPDLTDSEVRAPQNARLLLLL